MKSKGFTLIELLAVIAIIALIALIVSPIVMNIIDDTDEKSELRSAELYLHSVELAIAKTNMSSKLADSTCIVLEGGNLDCDVLNTPVEVEIKNRDQVKGGTITIEERKIVRVRNLKIGNGTYNLGTDGKLVLGEVNAPCTRSTDSEGFDTVTCGTETFYVMNEDANTITMLAKYNLDVGNIAAPDNNCTGRCESILTPITNPTGIQKAEARGWVAGEDTAYGVLPFSETAYWNSNDIEREREGNKTSYIDKLIEATPMVEVSSGNSTPITYDYIYNENSLLYEHVENYETYLKNNGVSSATARLMSYEEAINLGCSNSWCSPIGGRGEETGATAPTWLYSTTYWLGSSIPDDSNFVWLVDSYGFFDSGSFDDGYGGGVRPVVNISTSEI